ncbi:tRNA methyltransferase 10 homolog B isoform X2 [Silurus meridionalis]|uniref:tRNA methyltransferase 10 homolog B isoform X2 n=1 Tax=Silurus meridionalis TaxID=175797 RepID=UPI001EEBAE89|nr:tRNA methyltransferase 10 homolog B isoform X2 [Silurus meridionalis]KAI5104467.1 tRNA methyltransferase 10-like B isoform X1 [Silurus meridionalis]
MNESVGIVEKQNPSFGDRGVHDESVSDMIKFLSIDVDLISGSSNREETLCSKNVMRKQRNWERRLEAKKNKRKEEKQRRKQNRQDKGVESQLSKRVMKAITRERLEEARAAGPRLCVDLSMSDCMSHKEISRLAGQIRRLYGSNKKAVQPFHLFLTDMKEDSLLYKECIRMNEGFLNYLMDITEESWIDLFPSHEVIYLTPDASEALEEVNGNKVYILGGLVDESIQKKRTYTRAKELGVQMARLPIDEYMMKRPNIKNFHSKILAINQVFEILLTYGDTGSWSKALRAGVPTGKGYIVSSEAESNDDQ